MDEYGKDEHNSIKRARQRWFNFWIAVGIVSIVIAAANSLG